MLTRRALLASLIAAPAARVLARPPISTGGIVPATNALVHLSPACYLLPPALAYELRGRRAGKSQAARIAVAALRAKGQTVIEPERGVFIWTR